MLAWRSAPSPATAMPCIRTSPSLRRAVTHGARLCLQRSWVRPSRRLSAAPAVRVVAPIPSGSPLRGPMTSRRPRLAVERECHPLLASGGQRSGESRGQTRSPLEMHPNFVVYNPETLLAEGGRGRRDRRQLRSQPPVLADDRSHAAVRALKDCIWHVHAMTPRSALQRAHQRHPDTAAHG